MVTKKVQSYLSVGYYDEEGAVKGYDYSRYNFRLKTTYKPFDWLTIKPALSGSLRNIDDRQYSVTAMYSMLHGIVPMTKTATWFLTATVVG